MNENENLPAVSNVDMDLVIANQIENDNSLSDLSTLGRSFLSSFSIAYGSSPIVAEKGIARPGEFVFANQTSLGNKDVELVVVDFRFHAAYQNKEDYRFKDHIYHLHANPTPIKQDKAFQDFIKAESIPAGFKLADGADLLIYIVGQQSFASWYCKATLSKFVDRLYQASRGGRVIKVSSVYKTWKSRVWYELDIQPTKLTLNNSKLSDPSLDKSLVIPNDKFQSAWDLFQNPSKGVVPDTEEESGTTIER